MPDVKECVQSVEKRWSADQITPAEIDTIDVVLRTIYASQRNSDDKSAGSLQNDPWVRLLVVRDRIGKGTTRAYN